VRYVNLRLMLVCAGDSQVSLLPPMEAASGDVAFLAIARVGCSIVWV